MKRFHSSTASTIRVEWRGSCQPTGHSVGFIANEPDGSTGRGKSM